MTSAPEPKKNPTVELVRGISGILSPHLKSVTTTPSDDNGEKEIVTRVLEAMLKEKQTGKRNVEDRIPEQLLDEFFKMSLSPDIEIAYGNFMMFMIIANFDPNYLLKIHAELREIKATNAFKVRLVDAMQKKKKVDGVCEEPLGEVVEKSVARVSRKDVEKLKSSASKIEKLIIEKSEAK